VPRWLLLVVLMLAMIVPAFAQQQARKPAPAKHARGEARLNGEVNASAYTTGGAPSGWELTAEKARSLGFEFASSGKAVLPAKVTRVAPGSPALIGGLAAGDRILYGSVNGNTTSLILQRGSKMYQANLSDTWLKAGACKPCAEKALAAQAAGTALNGSVAAATLQQQLQILSGREVAIVIDRSGSMATPDCPGPTTRWQWCAQQVENLSRTTAPVLQQGLTVAVFANDYEVHNNVTVDDVRQIFETNTPGGGTRTERPLQSILSDYLSRGRQARPLAVAVITDGEPNDPPALADVLIDATRLMVDPNQVSITFLQVGDGAEGAEVLQSLDDDLVSLGAKYDIVDHKSFAQVQQLGLIGALVASITELRTPSVASPTVARHSDILVRRAPRVAPAAARASRAGAAPQGYGGAFSSAQQAQTERQLQQVRQERSDIERMLLQGN